MKRWRQFLLALLMILLLVGCEDGLYSGTLIFDGQHSFEDGAQLPGDVYVRAGTTELAAGSRVAGSVYMLGGTLLVNGRIDGDLSLLGGRLELGPEALVGGDLRLGGGEISQAETTTIQGQVVEGNGLTIPEMATDSGHGWEQLLRELSAALLLAGLGALLAHSRPQPLANVGRAVVDNALVCGALGLLILLVLPALLVMMAFTIFLIPLVIILGLLLFLLLGYGLAAVGGQLGQWLGRRLGRELSPAATTFGGTLILFLLFEIPFLGSGLLAIAAVLVLGAALLTRLGLRPYVPPDPVGGGDLSSYKRPSE